MIDAEGNVAGAAAREIEDEVGHKLNAKDPIDMTKLAIQQDSTEREEIQDALYPSPGGCDEFMNIYPWKRVRDRLEIEYLKNKLRGDRAAMENIIVTLEKYEKPFEVGVRDGKTLAAWSLYEYIKRVHPHVLKEEEEEAF